ncbi:MAG TPA: hypothetical protein VIV14_04140, partial [Gammaproteobacteria bacterium]
MDADGCLRVRDEIKRVELATERLQLETLESMSSGKVSSSLDQLLSNVGRYLSAYTAHAGIVLDGDVLELCAQIASAAYPEASQEYVDELWAEMAS